MGPILRLPSFGAIAVGRMVAVSALLFAAATGNAWAAEAPLGQPQLQMLLRNGDFAALEQALSDVERAYATGATTDDAVDYAYAALSSADPALEGLLSQWIAERPDSHRPHLARGVYYQHLGWIYRGDAFAFRTARARFERMEEHFSLAMRDMEAALDRAPTSGLTYSYLIGMHMAQGERQTMEALLRAGLAADPGSFTIRRRYLASLTPWWGGGRPAEPRSLQRRLLERLTGRHFGRYPVDVPAALHRFAGEIEADAAKMPALRPLLGYVDLVVAEMLRRDGRAETAIAYYDAAVQSGDWWYYHDAAGDNYYRLARYEDAIRSYTRSLELRPDNQGVLKSRAEAHRRLGAHEAALADVDQALSLDPLSPTLILEKARVLTDLQRYNEAVAVLEDARTYGKYDADIWGMRGYLQLYSLNEPALALDDLKRATELNPTHHSYWYYYGSALYALRDCEAVTVYKKYLAVCEKYDNRCDRRAQRFVRDAIDAIDAAQICPT